MQRGFFIFHELHPWGLGLRGNLFANKSPPKALFDKVHSLLLITDIRHFARYFISGTSNTAPYSAAYFIVMSPSSKKSGTRQDVVVAKLISS
jgi:hypothetical protein